MVGRKRFTVVDLGPLTGAAAPTDGRTPPPGPRPLSRRRGLPGSRAVAGGLLVATAAVGLFAAYAGAGRGPHRSYVVARRALTAGTIVTAPDLALQPMDLPSSVSSQAFTRVAGLVGSTVVSPLAAGELLQASGLVATRAGGSRTLSFPVPPSHLGPLKRGERVDVVATYGTGAEAWSTLVLRQAPVVDVDQGKSALGDTGSTVLTVAVSDPGDEVALAHAVALGKLNVVVATGAPAVLGPPPTYRSGPAPGTRAP